MKTALKGLQARVRSLRSRWHLAQARWAIAGCNRRVARRKKRLGAAPARHGHFFAPGTIEGYRARRSGAGRFTLTVVVALVSLAVLVWRGVPA